MARIELVRVAKRWGEVTAVEPTDVAIDDGEFVAILGPSGCGKSTTLFMLAGIYEPSEGDILFDGQSVAGRKSFEIARIGIARTFQNIRLFDELSVLENVMVGADAARGGAYFSALLGLGTELRREADAARDAMALLASFSDDMRKLVAAHGIGVFGELPATSTNP